jgi:PAS domain S-box-containing protein
MSKDLEDLALAVGLTPAVLSNRLATLGLDAAARASLRAAAPLAERGASEFLDALYARLLSHAETAVLLSNPEQIARLKLQQRRYLAELFGAELDWSYALGRLRTGVVHHRVKLSPRWYVTTYAHFVCEHVEPLLLGAPTPEVGLERVSTLVRSVFFDASLVLDAYGRSEEAALWLQVQTADSAERASHPAASEAVAPANTSEGARPGFARIRLTSAETAERRRFVGLGDDEVAVLRTLRPTIARATPAVLDDFYDWFSKTPDTARLVSPELVAGLKQSVASYWLELVDGAFDRPYAASRMRVGVIHEKIGLGPPWYLIGLARQVTAFVRELAREHAEPARAISVFVRAVFFDVSFVIDAYLDARTSRLLQTDGYANQLVAGLASAVAVVDGHDRLLSANRTLLAMLGGDPSVLYLMPLDSALPIGGAQQLVRRLRDGASERVAGIGRLGERTLRITALRLDGAPDGDERAIALVMDDVTELLRVAEDFRDQSRHLDQVADCVDVVLWEQDDRSWTITAVNRAVREVTGYRDVYFLGRKDAWLDCILPDDRDAFRTRANALKPGEKLDLDYRMTHADGREVWVRTRLSRPAGGAPERLHGATVDVTAARLNESLRLEAVGQLAGGVAHVVNNSLTALLGNLELHADRLGGLEAHPLLQRAVEASGRTAAMASRLLAFAGRQLLQPVVVSPLDVARNARATLQTLLGPTTELRISTDDRGWRCRVDPRVLAAALGCLASNAREALGGGGTVSIELENRVGRELAPDDPGRGRDWVELAFTDTGCGMSDEVRAHALEPFFTTRSLAQSPGLGLSMVYGFVVQSGGHVLLESEPGRGTTVRLRFPRFVASAPLAGGDASGLSDFSVWVVEDDADVRAVTVETVRRLGCRVHEAASAREALELARESLPDVLVADVLLGGGEDGIALARALLERREELAVILVSGYSAARFDLAGLPPNTQFLAKPFTLAALDRALSLATKLLR